MVAFDTDVLSRLLYGDGSMLTQASKLEPGEQSVPIVVLEEVMRGRLNSIRRAESRQTGTPLERAYELFERTFTRLRHVAVLSYGAAADEQFQAWRQQKLRLSTHDLRIAAICVAESATLATCNRRDFERVPELTVEFWDEQVLRFRNRVCVVTFNRRTALPGPPVLTADPPDAPAPAAGVRASSAAPGPPLH